MITQQSGAFLQEGDVLFLIEVKVESNIYFFSCSIKDVIKMDKRLSEIYFRWEDKIDKDEWYFSNSFESITKDMSAEEAFNYIPNVVDMLLKLDDDYLIWETLYFLISLYNIAETTQIHLSLEDKWNELEEHIRNYDDSFGTPYNELKRYLRIKD
ncbi:ABC transporter [Fictibacillus phosphorivorans]|uniref:ABC transporter n=1 Tax=Fictibacillus phosphorivorans TaxID=1221500 RepID=UPI000A888CE1|nr:ABC transporter [Fictibacillus phosphorivorans]